MTFNDSELVFQGGGGLLDGLEVALASSRVEPVSDSIRMAALEDVVRRLPWRACAVFERWVRTFSDGSRDLRQAAVELLSEARDHVRRHPKDADSLRRVINDAVFALARIAEIDEDLTTKIVDDVDDLAWPFAAAPKQRQSNDEKRTNAEGDNARFEKTEKSRFEPSVNRRKRAVLVSAVDIIMRPKQWIWPGHLLRGTQELFSGKPGIGKSQVQIDLVARATRGDGWPDGARGVAPMNVIMLTAEDSLDQEVIPRLRAADANLERIRFLVSIKRDTNGDRMFLLGEDLEDLERAIVDWGDVGLVTIDPITAFMGYGRFDARRVTDVRSQLSPLKELAEKMNVAFSTITHPPKSAGPRAIDHFIESQAFIAAGRIGHLAIEELDEKKIETGRIFFATAKNNSHERMPTLAYRIAICSVVSDKSVGDILAPRVVWETKPVDITADAATYAAFQASGRASSGTLDRKPTLLDEATKFLSEKLADGPVSADEMFAAADEDGITKITLKRAKKALKVVSKPDGFQGKIIWSLPSGDHVDPVGINTKGVSLTEGE